MNKRITFRGMPHSGPMEDHANQQLMRIEEFLLKEDRIPITIELVMTNGKLHAHHSIELRVKSPNYDVFTQFEGADFYETLDRVIDVAYRSLLEAKDRHVEDRKMLGRHEEFKKQR